MRSPERTGWMPVVSARARAATLRMAAGSVSSELEVDDSISSESSPSRLEPRAFELGGEGGRLGVDGPCDQALVLLGKGAHDDEVAAGRGACGFCEPVERLRKRAVLEQPAGRPTDALEQLFFPFVCDPPHEPIMRLRPAQTGCGGPRSVNIVRPSGPQPRIRHLRTTRPSTLTRSNAGWRTRGQNGARVIEHKRETRRARIRFLFLLLGLILLTLFISLSIWQKIQDVFGL